MNEITDQITYRNISLLVRPTKAAILISKNDKYWKHIILQIFKWCSSIWGGAYFVIIPTDGNNIEPQFWSILQEYSPDHVYSYDPTLADLEFADPKEYISIVGRYREDFFTSFPELDEIHFLDWMDRDFKNNERFAFEISPELQQEIKQRLTPYYNRGIVVEPAVRAYGSVPFPLTNISEILQSSPDNVWVARELADIDCSLLFFSNWGLYTPEFVDVLSRRGLSINYIPGNAKPADLLRYSLTKSIKLTGINLMGHLQENLNSEDKSWYPDVDITQLSPYELSLLKCSKYKTHEPYYGEEPITFIVGDSVEDFCLYYSLSRIQSQVYWIPKAETSAKDGVGSNDDDLLILMRAVASTISEQLGSGGSNNTIRLSSLSIPKEELEASIGNFQRLVFLETNRFIYEPAPWLLKKATLLLFEQNNYTNQYTEVFRNNKSVGVVPTPRPKNFGQVIPYDHRWVTEFYIDGFRPPQLHFLGKEIVDLHGSTSETRVSKNGICYTCPNRGYFGGDIDVTLVRPHIRILEPFDIFRMYFGEAGHEIRVSDKGGFTQSSIDKFGSLDEIGDFLRDGTGQTIFSLFRRTSSSNNDSEGEVVFVNQRAYVDFNALQKIIGSEENTIRLIDNFTRKGIFHRGTILYCIYCRNADWYRIHEVDRTFVCHRCRHEQTLEQRNWKQGKEPTWFYGLDEVIFQGVKNEMTLPLLVLKYLKNQSKNSFLYVPEVEFQKNGISETEGEIDICCIQDGKIILGECRKTKIDKKLITKVESFSRTLLKKPDMLVFATMDREIDANIVNFAKSKLSIPHIFLNEWTF